MQVLKENQEAELITLYHRAYAANEDLGIHFKAAKLSQAELTTHLQSQPIFIKCENQKIVSTLGLRLPWSVNPGPYPLPHLSWVATDPQFQQKSYAKTLISDVIENYVIKELKAPAVTLGTAAEHPWLIKAYQKLGFHYLAECQLFPDHKTVYLIKIIDQEMLAYVKSDPLQKALKMEGLVE